jgi:hypothetical protein
MIHVFKSYYIDGDSYNYILKRKTRKKDQDGEIIYDVEGYYTTIEGAINGLRQKFGREKIAHGKEITLAEAYKQFKNLNKEFDKVISSKRKE